MKVVDILFQNLVCFMPALSARHLDDLSVAMGSCWLSGMQVPSKRDTTAGQCMQEEYNLILIFICFSALKIVLAPLTCLLCSESSRTIWSYRCQLVTCYQAPWISSASLTVTWVLSLPVFRWSWCV